MTDVGPTAAESYYPPDYASAREQFRTLAARRGFRLEAFPIGPKGPGGEELTIDVALGGAEQPSRAVVVSSGLHGVEGFFGSAVQAALLDDVLKGWSPEAGAGLILLHALDPYGFAWIRRQNEENVDLNRNFLVEGEPYRGAPEHYSDLDPLLNPPRVPSFWDLFFPRAVLSVLRHGMPYLKQVVAEGQYEYPKGLFFGGRGPSQTYSVLAENLPRWIGDAEDVIHVDFHTGLGPWGTYQLLLEGEISPARIVQLKEWFGDDHVQWSEPTGIAYRTRGGLGGWCQSMFADRSYSVLCAEFGTYGPLTVTAALRAENQTHHWGTPGDARWAKARLKQTFVPADRRWRETVLRKGVGVVTTAFAAILESDELLAPGGVPREAAQPPGAPPSAGTA